VDTVYSGHYSGHYSGQYSGQWSLGTLVSLETVYRGHMLQGTLVTKVTGYRGHWLQGTLVPEDSHVSMYLHFYIGPVCGDMIQQTPWNRDNDWAIITCEQPNHYEPW